MWLEGLAGALSGAAGGMQDVQQQRQKQAQLKMQEQQMQMEQTEAKRRAVMEAYKTLQPGQEVDPVQASEFKQMGLGGLTAEGSKIIKAKTPQDQLLDLTYQSAQEEAADRQRNRALFDKIHNAGSGWYELPPQQRQSEWTAGGGKGDDWMTPEEKVRFNPAFQGAQVAAQSRMSAARMSAGASGQITPAVRARLDQQMYDTAVRTATAKSKDVLGNVDPVKYEQNLSIELARVKQGVNAAPAGQPAPAASGQPVQVGKYKVQY